jgi:hypothetical protein
MKPQWGLVDQSPSTRGFLVPISPEVVEQNPECITSGEYRDGILVISLSEGPAPHVQYLPCDRVSWSLSVDDRRDQMPNELAKRSGEETQLQSQPSLRCTGVSQHRAGRNGNGYHGCLGTSHVGAADCRLGGPWKDSQHGQGPDGGKAPAESQLRALFEVLDFSSP